MNNVFVFSTIQRVALLNTSFGGLKDGEVIGERYFKVRIGKIEKVLVHVVTGVFCRKER
jgi:hypothetical protein